MIILKRHRLLAGILIISLGVSWFNISIAEQMAYIVFSNNPFKQGEEINPGEAKESFNCGETIHAIAGVEGLTKGEYSLEARWTDPSGEIAKRDDFQLSIPRESQVAYVSTSIMVERTTTESTETVLGPYAGTWTVELFVDGTPIGNNSFNLNC